MIRFLTAAAKNRRRQHVSGPVPTAGVDRREWLRIGTLAGLGAVTGNVIAANEREQATVTAPGFGRAKSVILVFTSGGQSQLDMWDPKPQAPPEVRGAFSAIPTAIPGVAVTEHLPQLAKLADRYTLLRTLSHEDLDHGSAVYLTLTGHYHRRRSSNPTPAPTDRPVHGAILNRVRPERDALATAVHVNGPAIIAPNNISPGQFGGLLGREHDALTVGDVSKQQAVVPGLTPQDGLPLVRLQQRQHLLTALDQAQRDWPRQSAAADLQVLYDRAFAMLADPATRAAFDLQAEPQALRDRYGRHRSGQACLLARRLVEAGVPMITVFWNHHSRGQDHHPEETDAYGWDTHNDIFTSLKDRLIPRFDQSISTLLLDLEQRGLLNDTLVLCCGEFGRAPLVAYEAIFQGTSPGRKHWAACYSAIAAGAGVNGGAVLGKSDRFGAYPASESYGPWDLSATMFSALGIPPQSEYHDATRRPYRVSEGRVITGLYS